MKFLFITTWVMGVLLNPGLVSAEVREEFEEQKPSRIEIESLERDVIAQKENQKLYKFSSMIEFVSTYDTNPRMTAIRKSDTSGEMRYSLFYKRLLVPKLFFTFNYNLDGTAYEEYSELSNILNHVRVSIDKVFSNDFSAGTGYDLSSFYYPDTTESDFYFHKFFFYLKNQITPKFYHQIMLEEGFKDYVHARAYSDSTSTYQDVDRTDYRHSIEYSIGASMMERLFFRLRSKFTINDSNSIFQDYYDYKAIDISPYISFKLTDKYLLNMSMTVSKKNYTSRRVASRADSRHDLIYTSNFGLRYTVDAQNTVSLGYGYNQGNSNDQTTEYSGSSVNCGWQHQF